MNVWEESARDCAPCRVLNERAGPSMVAAGMCGKISPTSSCSSFVVGIPDTD